jgi:hypothetical protein
MPLSAPRPLMTMAAMLLAAASGWVWPARADAPAGTYTTTATTATDTKTRLEWRRDASPSATSQAGAQAYCTMLGGGWRLPSVLELVSLVDEQRTGTPAPPALDPVFIGAPEYFWSATSYAGGGSPASGWIVNFENGDTLSQAVTTTARARCVR